MARASGLAADHFKDAEAMGSVLLASLLVAADRHGVRRLTIVISNSGSWSFDHTLVWYRE
jgi:hypothetical protein